MRQKAERQKIENETKEKIAEAIPSTVLAAARTFPTDEEFRITRLQQWREGVARHFEAAQIEARRTSSYQTVLSEEATLVQSIGLEAALNHVQQTEGILRGIEQTLHRPEDIYASDSDSYSDDGNW